jgi:hypothetical protein
MGSRGISLLCFSGEGSEPAFIGSRGVLELAAWGVKMKSRGGESNRQPPKLNSLRLQIPLSKTFLIRVIVPHRILTFWPHWCTRRGVSYLSS